MAPMEAEAFSSHRSGACSSSSCTECSTRFPQSDKKGHDSYVGWSGTQRRTHYWAVAFSSCSVESTHSLREIFVRAARENAREQAKRAFLNAINPYITKPDAKEARSIATTVYYAIDNASVLGWTSSEAQENVLAEVKAGYLHEMDKLSAEHGAEGQALQHLLVLARTDKVEDNGIPSSYASERATIQAYNSLLSEGLELTEILPLLRKRMEVYQRFYEEFEPAKEED